MGLRLEHRDLGGEGRPPLVILHGMLGSSRNWQTAGRDLAGRFHVLALDARNHGRSPHDGVMSYRAMAEDVLRWLDARGLGRVTLMGHSMGGKTAMWLACHHPERVERLLVVDIAPRDYRAGHWAEHQEEFAAMQAVDLGHLRNRAEAEAQLSSRITDWGMMKFLATNLEQDANGAWRWAVNLPVLAAALPVLEGNPLAPGDRFGGPAHFIAGEKSDYIRPEDREGIRAHFPAATLDVIAGSGHNPHVEMREKFVALVERLTAAPTAA